MVNFERNNVPLLATYVALMALGVFMFAYARTFPGASMGPAGPGFFPQIVAVLLVALCAVGAAQTFRGVEERVSIPRNVLIAMVLSLAYVGVMYYVGYYASTFLFAFAVMWGARQGASALLVLRDSTAILIVSYLFFEIAIDANLPTGILLR